MLSPLTGPPIPTAGRPAPGAGRFLSSFADVAAFSEFGDIRSRALDGTASVVLERSIPEAEGGSIFVSIQYQTKTITDSDEHTGFRCDSGHAIAPRNVGL